MDQFVDIDVSKKSIHIQDQTYPSNVSREQSIESIKETLKERTEVMYTNSTYSEDRDFESEHVRQTYRINLDSLN